MKLAAAAVTIKYGGGDVQGGGHTDPDLPVREKAGNGKFAREADIGGKPPESKHIRHQGGRDQQGGEG